MDAALYRIGNRRIKGVMPVNDGDTIMLCRCYEVSKAAIEEAISNGAVTVRKTCSWPPCPDLTYLGPASLLRSD